MKTELERAIKIMALCSGQKTIAPCRTTIAPVSPILPTRNTLLLPMAGLETNGATHAVQLPSTRVYLWAYARTTEGSYFPDSTAPIAFCARDANKQKHPHLLRPTHRPSMHLQRKSLESKASVLATSFCFVRMRNQRFPDPAESKSTLVL